MVRILQLGYGGDVTYGYEDLLGQVNDVILSTANWTDFSSRGVDGILAYGFDQARDTSGWHGLGKTGP